jgi:xanthine/CO dehydrogenase XdhC/CoxF family maturation factor
LKEPSEILELFTSAFNSGQQMVLATVVDVNGSAYRRPGAHLLLVEDGRKAGSISAGCLENDILARGKEVFALPQPLLLEYESDEFFGLNYGCDGTIRVLVQPVTDTGVNFPNAYRLAGKTGQTLGLATIYDCQDQQRIGTQVLFNQVEIIASTAANQISTSILEDCKTSLESAKNRTVLCEHSDTKVFLEIIKPSLRLAIFGAGDDVIPLLAIAHSVGIETHIVDSRRSYLERFSDTQSTQHFNQDFDAKILLEAASRTAIVIMSHNFELDKRFLTTALASECAYIGLMGSRKRTLKMLAELGREEDSVRIKFPIGLDLGADSPEEIALSICSEILSFFRNASGKPLSTLSGPIHQRPADEDESELLCASAQQTKLSACLTGSTHE